MNTKNNKWDVRFIEMARMIASWSKDPNTQCGAVIVNERREVVSVGFNGFPRGIADDERLQYRDAKLAHVVHGETNAVLAAGHGARGATLYNWPGAIPCADCAKTVIQSGITRVVGPDSCGVKWIESARQGREMLTEVGVVIDLVDIDDWPKPGRVRFDGSPLPMPDLQPHACEVSRAVPGPHLQCPGGRAPSVKNCAIAARNYGEACAFIESRKIDAIPIEFGDEFGPAERFSTARFLTPTNGPITANECEWLNRFSDRSGEFGQVPR